MKNGYRNIITSRWLRAFSFLAIVYFSQAYQFYHLHHFHDESGLEVAISSHPTEVDLGHSSDHNHDDNTPHTNNHQHTYAKRIDWHITRTQYQRALAFDDCIAFSPILFDVTNGNSTSYIDCDESLSIVGNYTLPVIIRGPPVLG